MLNVNKEQRAANVVFFHSYTRDSRLISVLEGVPPISTGVLRQRTTTATENGVLALVRPATILSL